MRVLVTGGAGYIGSRLVPDLLAAGHYVMVIDRLDFGGDGLLAHVDHPRFRYWNLDLARDEFVWTETVDAVIHLAAIVGEPACRANPQRAIRSNVETVRYAVPFVELGARFILFSTCSNYGVVQGELATEDTPLNPTGIYAETKIEAERLVLEAGGTVLRCGTICGVSPRMRFDLLVNEIGRAAALELPIQIYNSQAWRPFLHIRDVGRIVRFLLSYRGDISGIWNVVGQNVQKMDLARIAQKHWRDMPVEIRDGGDDPRDYRVSSAKLSELLPVERPDTVESAMLEACAATSMLADRDRKIYRNVA